MKNISFDRWLPPTFIVKVYTGKTIKELYLLLGTMGIHKA